MLSLPSVTIGTKKFRITDQVESVYILATTGGTSEVLRKCAIVLPRWMAVMNLPAVPVRLTVEEWPDKPGWRCATTEFISPDGKGHCDLSEITSTGVAGIWIGFAARSYSVLTRWLKQPCTCEYCVGPRVPPHIDGFHSMLHELVHLRYPKHQFDNNWTDQKVAEMLTKRPLGTAVIVGTSKGVLSVASLSSR